MKLSNFCPLPWNHISTTSSGSYRLCCNSDESQNKIVISNDKNTKIYRERFSTVRNSELLKSVRRQIISGEIPDVCKPCFEAEDRNEKSPRLSYLDSYSLDEVFVSSHTDSEGEIDPSLFPVEYIDIRLGNLCNLKCRMCNSWSSSSWNEESKAIFATEDVGLLDWPAKKVKWIEEVISHSDLQELYLTGGEPTLIEENIKLLEKLLSLEMASVRIKINSNLVHLSPKFIKTLESFEQVLFKCSIDGLGLVNDYIRYPSNFEVIAENLRLIQSKFSFEIQSTIQAYNIFSAGKWISWCREELNKAPDFYILSEPSWLDIRNLNPKFKETVSNIFKGDSAKLSQSDQAVLNTLLSETSKNYDPKIESELKKYTKAMDRYRSQNVSDFIPELSVL